VVHVTDEIKDTRALKMVSHTGMRITEWCMQMTSTERSKTS